MPVAFIENLPSAASTRYRKPTVKTLRDKFRLMMKARDDKNRVNERATGLGGGEATRAELLLCDLLLEVREYEEERHKTREEQQEKKKLLDAAGEAMQAQALERSIREPGSARKKRKARCEDFDFDGSCADRNADMEANKKLRSEELALRKSEIELQEKIFEEAQKDLEAMRKEQSATLELLAAMAHKLNQ